MSYRLVSPIGDSIQTVGPTAAADVDKGEPVVFTSAPGGATIHAFSENDVTTGDVEPVYIVKAKKVEVDVAGGLNYAAMDEVYDDAATPTGVLNKTPGKLVGRIVRPVDYTSVPGGGKAIIAFNGEDGTL